MPSERLSGSSGMCERAPPAISVPWWCFSISRFIVGFKQIVSFTFTYHTDEFKVFSECASLSLPSPRLTELIYDKIYNESLPLFNIFRTCGLVSGMIKSFTVSRLAAVLLYVPAPRCGADLTRAAHKLKAALWFRKCHSILKGYLTYYIAPPSTHLLFVNYAHDSERCHSSTALRNLQYDHFLIFSLSLHMGRCRRCTALSRFPAGAMSHSHPYAVTHTVPATPSHTHASRCCCWLEGAVMEKWEMGFFERSF